MPHEQETGQAHMHLDQIWLALVPSQVFIDAPHLASGPIPDDVLPYFEGPYYEWVTAEETPVGVEFDLKKVSTACKEVHEYIYTCCTV